LTADVGPVDGRRQFAVVGLPTNAGVDFVARPFCKLFLWNKTYRQFFVVNIKWDFIFRIGNSRTQIFDQKII
jgi:hypothetical protein